MAKIGGAPPNAERGRSADFHTENTVNRLRFSLNSPSFRHKCFLPAPLSWTAFGNFGKRSKASEGFKIFLKGLQKNIRRWNFVGDAAQIFRVQETCRNAEIVFLEVLKTI